MICSASHGSMISSLIHSLFLLIYLKIASGKVKVMFGSELIKIFLDMLFFNFSVFWLINDSCWSISIKLIAKGELLIDQLFFLITLIRFHRLFTPSWELVDKFYWFLKIVLIIAQILNSLFFHKWASSVWEFSEYCCLFLTFAFCYFGNLVCLDLSLR